MKLPITVLVGFVLSMLLPHGASAQSPSCDAFRDVQPISTHYVGQVLARADAGIAFAASMPADATDFAQYAPGWIRTVDSGLRAMVDSHVRVTQQQRDLPDRTACLHIDQAILQCKAVEVTQRLHEALESGSWQGVWILAQILPYLQERERQLLRGALSPRYRDRDWSVRRPFDPEDAPFGTFDSTTAAVCGDRIISAGEDCDDGNTLSGDGCSESCRSEVCPFDSHYAEDSFMGGCTAEVLAQGNRLSFAPAAAEYDALLFLEQSYAGFRQNAAELVSLQQQIAAVANGEDANAVVPAPLPERQHIAGCVAGRGVCSAVPTLSCIEDNDCLGVLGGSCVITTLQNTAFWPPRHSLSLERDHLRILAVFQEMRRRQGTARRQRSDLLLAGERREDGSVVTERQIGIAESALLPARRAYYTSISAQQGQAEAALFATAADPQRMMAAALQNLRGSVAALADLAGDREGLRGLLVRFGYFLLRSCADRPCNLQLQQTIKFALTDECFPYTSGAFLQHSCENPSWKVCAEAAQAQHGGVFANFLPEPRCE